MKSASLPLILVAVAGFTAACLVPAPAFERAAWGPPPPYWQEQGRFAQQAAPGEPSPAASAAAPSNTAANSPKTGEPPSGAGAAPAEPPLNAPLYSWDGGIVDGAPQGRVTEQESPRGLETPAAGRMHIIELYQQVLDERDALAHEVEELRATLEKTSLALEAESKQKSELEARVISLEEAHRGALADNQALAQRLVTAQIRRLEAEKLLLETRLEIERAREREAAEGASLEAGAGKGGARTRASAEERKAGRP